MTLKEKFKQWLDTEPRIQIREVQLEVIADEYAIEFANWFVLRYTEAVFYREDYTEDLLEEFKKEKGL